MFLVQGRPTVTAMLKNDNPDGILAEIKELRKIGMDTFGLQIDYLKPEYRKTEYLKKIFSAMDGTPCYVTNYRGGNPSADDEKLAETLLQVADYGPMLLDLRADMFAPCVDEFTEDAAAIAKQQAFIKAAHEKGAEVLMSTHVFNRFVPKDEVKKIAQAAAQRGADISKIVTTANNADELQQNIELITELKRELPIPFLFLCNGSHCRIHRIYGPMMGVCMYLAAIQKKEWESQPTIGDVKTAMTLAGYENLPW